jgi:hypothetical protein
VVLKLLTSIGLVILFVGSKEKGRQRNDKKERTKGKQGNSYLQWGKGHRVALHIVSWANKLLAETTGNVATILELYVVTGLL